MNRSVAALRRMVELKEQEPDVYQAIKNERDVELEQMVDADIFKLTIRQVLAIIARQQQMITQLVKTRPPFDWKQFMDELPPAPVEWETADDLAKLSMESFLLENRLKE